ncbi:MULTISPECIES: hypothetical protein [unclassified Clostridium]|nr:hypothetical protein [Clostridium sp.]MDY2630213.1 hypothetical protein [Clostridium sp.]MDY4251774.1 hypothetical protein [Clostridium sp.]MDY6228389.1 hypothetical protein [Clostridium sp.]
MHRSPYNIAEKAASSMPYTSDTFILILGFNLFVEIFLYNFL